MKTLSTLLAPAAFALVVGCDGSFSRGDGVTFFLEPLGADDMALAPGGANLVSGASLAEAVNHETVKAGLTWKVAGDATHFVPEPYTAQSRQYWLQIDSSLFEQGFQLHTTSLGSVVKLSPIGASSKAISIEDMLIQDRTGASFDAVDAVEMAATSDEFRPSEIPFAPGTTVFKFRPEFAAGDIQLKASDVSFDKALVHVFEPNSDVILSLQASSDTYLKGDQLEFVAKWSENVTPNNAKAEVRSPSGVVYEVALQESASGLLGRLPLEETVAKPGELWEITVQAEAEGSNGLALRTAQTAFAYSLGTASFEPTANVAEWPTKNDLKIRFGIHAGSAGRYAVNGVLYGTSSTGELVPFLVSQAAATVQPGKNEVELVFSQAEIKASGLSAPFEVRDLRLLDQTRLGLLHRQWRALVLPQ
jgi:hypothetical protein